MSIRVQHGHVNALTKGHFTVGKRRASHAPLRADLRGFQSLRVCMFQWV